MTIQDAFLLLLAIGEGAAMGSFLTVIASRLPRLMRQFRNQPGGLARIAHGLCWPSSHCDACHEPLGWADKIPLLSYLWLRGHCRHCGHAFGAGYMLLELAGVAVGLVSALLWGWSLNAVLCFVALSFLLALYVTDLRAETEPEPTATTVPVRQTS